MSSPDAGATCPSCGATLAQSTGRCPDCGAEARREVETSGVVGEDSFGPNYGHDDGLFAFSLRYPLSNEAGPILIGALLALLSVLVVPGLLLLGYAVRVGRAAARGDDAIPEFEDWGALLENGLLFVVATLPYALVSAVVAGAPFALAAQVDGTAASLLAVGGGALSVVFAVGMAALLPTFVATGSVRGSYADLRFARVALSREFVVGLLVHAGIGVVLLAALAIAVGLLLVTIVGILAIPFVVLFVSAYATYLTWALWGYVCWDAEGHAVLGRLAPGTSLDVEF